MKRFQGLVGLFVCGGILALAPVPAAAQTSCPPTNTPTNKCFVRTLFFLAPIAGEDAATVNQVADQSADELTKFIQVTLSTTPVASSSGGFSFVRNKAGEREFKSASYGPVFADRPLTNGKGVLNAGFNFQFGSTDFEGGFGTADGRTVGLPTNDEKVTYKSDGFVQYITRRSFLQTESRLYSFYASYGVTESLDVGVLVPVVSLTLTGRREEAWDLSKTQDRSPVIEDSFVTGGPTSQSASGIGDVTLRFKYSLTNQLKNGVAVAADVRMPTGNEDDLLGTGKASVRLQLLVLKTHLGPASIHGNVGYTAGGLSDEFNYVGGFDVTLLKEKRLTLSASFLGRTLQEGALPTAVETTNPNHPANIDPSSPTTLLQERFRWDSQSLNLSQVAGGAKLRLTGNWLLTAGVLVPVTQRGFQPGVMTVIGLDYTWLR